VLEEGCGTCTTKHATLTELAREQRIDVQLVLGIYEMNERNTPGVGRVLGAYGLSCIPEAHYSPAPMPAGAQPRGRVAHPRGMHRGLVVG
jgi:hypothetical protein